MHRYPGRRFALPRACDSQPVGLSARAGANRPGSIQPSVTVGPQGAHRKCVEQRGFHPGGYLQPSTTPDRRYPFLPCPAGEQSRCMSRRTSSTIGMRRSNETHPGATAAQQACRASRWTRHGCFAAVAPGSMTQVKKRAPFTSRITVARTAAPRLTRLLPAFEPHRCLQLSCGRRPDRTISACRGSTGHRSGGRGPLASAAGGRTSTGCRPAASLPRLAVG